MLSFCRSNNSYTSILHVQPFNISMNIVESTQQSTYIELEQNEIKWILKARVTSKGPVLPLSNARGKLFSMDLSYENGEIRAIVYNELCDKFNEMIEVDKVYYISQYLVTSAKKEYSLLDNDIEILFTNDTIIEEYNDNFNYISTSQ